MTGSIPVWVEVNMPWSNPGAYDEWREAQRVEYAKLNEYINSLLGNPPPCPHIDEVAELARMHELLDLYPRLEATEEFGETAWLAEMLDIPDPDVHCIARRRHHRGLERILEKTDPVILAVEEKLERIHAAAEKTEFKHHELCVPGVVVEVRQEGKESEKFVIGHVDSSSYDAGSHVFDDNSLVLRYMDLRPFYAST